MIFLTLHALSFTFFCQLPLFLFSQIYSKCFPTGNANEFCDHVFRTFDTDKNGYIDFKEFLLVRKKNIIKREINVPARA